MPSIAVESSKSLPFISCHHQSVVGISAAIDHKLSLAHKYIPPRVFISWLPPNEEIIKVKPACDVKGGYFLYI